METDTHRYTHTQTHKPSTVTLAAHVRRGLTTHTIAYTLFHTQTARHAHINMHTLMHTHTHTHTHTLLNG